jgi:hypothetical protein
MVSEKPYAILLGNEATGFQRNPKTMKGVAPPPSAAPKGTMDISLSLHRRDACATREIFRTGFRGQLSLFIDLNDN